MTRVDPTGEKIQCRRPAPEFAGLVKHDLELLGEPGQAPDLERGVRRRAALEALAKWHWRERAAAAALGRRRRSTMDAGRVLAALRTSPPLADAELEPLVAWIVREERIEEASESNLDPRFIAERLGCTVRTVEASQARMRKRRP